MRMDRIDALHYRLTRTYASGTKFAYRYTRGSWNSVEVGEDGLQGDAHAFFVPEVDAKRLTDVVYRWSDQNPTQPQVGPDTIPTPFNPNPFGGLPTPSGGPASRPHRRRRGPDRAVRCAELDPVAQRANRDGWPSYE